MYFYMPIDTRKENARTVHAKEKKVRDRVDEKGWRKTRERRLSSLPTPSLPVAQVCRCGESLLRKEGVSDECEQVQDEKVRTLLRVRCDWAL